MTARYSVIRYVPNPVTDECINIGVVAWDERQIHSQFVADWRRARIVSTSNVDFLRVFAKKFKLLSSLPSQQLQLEKMIGTWEHCIQFTTPRGSLKDAPALLAEVSTIFLHPGKSMRRKRIRSRRTAASMAANLIFEAVERRIGERAADLVARNRTLDGHYEQHVFDVVLENGKAFAAVRAMSFETNEDDRLEKEIDAAAWTLEDVRRKHRNLPMAVFVLPPSGASSAYDRAQKLFPELNAQLVLEDEMPRWARKQARSIPQYVR